jgi:hypothetical protein
LLLAEADVKGFEELNAARTMIAAKIADLESRRQTATRHSA